MRLKYIITENNDFVIFTELTEHSRLGSRLFGQPVGAGFCTIAREADSERANVHCFGESISLGIGSREEDETIINNAINGY